uniref:Uncharacterized protein n=1 Tax=Varanus komodoensis TaxID=61221 RepID=A0A8D2LRU3_VARKO
MRTRKLLYPTEKVWLDKYKYDEAERLFYEREATLAASAARTCQAVVAVNGFCHEEPVEEELKEVLRKGRNGKEPRKRRLALLRCLEKYNPVCHLATLRAVLRSEGKWLNFNRFGLILKDCGHLCE